MTIIWVTLFIIVICLLALSWFAGSDAPFVTSNDTKIRELLKIIGIKKNQVFYELGSGDGRVVFIAASLGGKAIGIEQSWIRVWYARFLAQKNNMKNTFFIHGNVFDRNYFPADYVYIFLLPDAVDRLETKLTKELKKGAIIITQTFHFKKLRPYKKIDLTGKEKIRLGENKYAGDFWIYKV